MLYERSNMILGHIKMRGKFIQPYFEAIGTVYTHDDNITSEDDDAVNDTKRRK